jgi:hypothetical protein
MRELIGSADTVGRLIEILSELPADAKVRVKTISHSWQPDVYDYGVIGDEHYYALEP